VRRAVVQRVWPNRLTVRLEEHRAAAWWHVEEREDKLVNRQGEVFEANPGDVEDENLPLLTGPEGTSAAMLAMHGRLQPVFDRLGLRLEALHLSARGSWRAVLDSGAEIELGRGIEDEVVARTQVFAATVKQLTARYQRALQYADLRHADGYALRLRGIGTVAPVATATRR
jgi:cell division protein FtsQ